MKEDLVKEIERALAGLLEESGDSDAIPEVSLEIPRQPEHGDFACSVAMGLAKRLRQSPRAIAEDLAARIGDAGGLLVEIDVAGPGFLNMRIGPAAWPKLTRPERATSVSASGLIGFSPPLRVPVVTSRG